MKENLTREENTIGRFTNWLDTLARRTRYYYIKKESTYGSYVCIDDVTAEVLRAEEFEISYTFSEGEGQFEFIVNRARARQAQVSGKVSV